MDEPSLKKLHVTSAKLTVYIGQAVQFCSLNSEAMKIPRSENLLFLLIAVLSAFVIAAGQPVRASKPTVTLLEIIRAEDQRDWNDDLKAALTDKDGRVRKRAALAAGRIGDQAAVPALADVLLTDRDNDVRQMAAFALGEIESPGGAYALTTVLKRRGTDLTEGVVRARAVEALGKIAAVIISNTPPAADPTKPPAKDDRLEQIRAAIVDTLRFEDSRRSRPDQLTILLGLTAVLRAKPDRVGPVVVRFLDYADAAIVATALNTMARLRLKDAPDRVWQRLNHSDPIVRANAARVIGIEEDKDAFDALLDHALHDQDLRVRVSAIRALGSLKDARAAEPLLKRALELFSSVSSKDKHPIRTADNEMLEIATALSRVSGAHESPEVLRWLSSYAQRRPDAPEIAIAQARLDPAAYASHSVTVTDAAFGPKRPKTTVDWRRVSSVAQGLKEIASAAESTAGIKDARAKALSILREDLNSSDTPALAIPDVLRSFVAFKSDSVVVELRASLLHDDVIVRATAAELLGEQAPSDANTRALIEALPVALADKDLNDAALAILDALGKQKNRQANEAIKTALDSGDHLIRWKAVAILKANGAGDFSDRIGLVKTRYTDADYRRALGRMGKKATATVETNRGAFTIEFLTEDAPLTVDNFIQLAKRGFFNGQTIPRVVPNFVIQAGDPRGDQNGGPGYQIRCEINEFPYERGAVGMALSGKDTGGSQWFVTHSPQPHLDGGYTVFGNVIRGMDVVDSIARGDRIIKVTVN